MERVFGWRTLCLTVSTSARHPNKARYRSSPIAHVTICYGDEIMCWMPRFVMSKSTMPHCASRFYRYMA